MTHKQFPGDEAGFSYDIERAIDALTGGPERDMVVAQIQKAEGELALDSAITLDDRITADLLGLRALANKCRRDRELNR